MGTAEHTPRGLRCASVVPPGLGQGEEMPLPSDESLYVFSVARATAERLNCKARGCPPAGGLPREPPRLPFFNPAGGWIAATIIEPVTGFNGDVRVPRVASLRSATRGFEIEPLRGSIAPITYPASAGAGMAQPLSQRPWSGVPRIQHASSALLFAPGLQPGEDGTSSE